MARLLLGTGRGRRGPHRAGVRRRLHQPAEDRLRPEIRPSWPRRGSPHPAGRRAPGVRLGARAGSESGRARRGGAGGGARRLGMDRGHPAAAAREWATMRADLRVSFVLRVVLGQVGTLAMVIAGGAVLWVGPGGLYWLVAGTLFSIIAALA